MIYFIIIIITISIIITNNIVAIIFRSYWMLIYEQ